MGTFVDRLLAAAMAVTLAVGCPTEISSAASLRLAGSLMGNLQNYQIAAGESLIEVARKFDLGFNAIVAANPGVDPWIPPAGTRINIPTAWILPDLPAHTGIVINLPELRLYFFATTPASPVVTFPLGIGDQGRDTPIGRYKVIEKVAHPAWRVPQSIRAEILSLPKVVPYGPDNPLGSHALRLSRGDILIHGTNRPWGIGRRSSHGCLRLYPEDIVILYKMIPKGTPVTVINQPVKAAALGDKVFVEVHRPETGENDVGQAVQLLAQKNLLARTDFSRLLQALQDMKGFPVDITLVP